jgi:hypothetical protein
MKRVQHQEGSCFSPDMEIFFSIMGAWILSLARKKGGAADELHPLGMYTLRSVLLLDGG